MVKPVFQKDETNQALNFPAEAVRQGEDNEVRVQQALARHNGRFTTLLAGRDERKMVQDNLIGELSKGFEHRRHALGMVLESRLHSIREACNHILVTGKTHLRQQRLEYFGQVYRKVEMSMSALSDQFLLDMDARFKRLDEFSSESIRQREQARLEKSVDDFLSTLDSLMDEFRNIIHENISHQSPAEAHKPVESGEFEEAVDNNGDPIMDMFMLGGNARPS